MGIMGMGGVEWRRGHAGIYRSKLGNHAITTRSSMPLNSSNSTIQDNPGHHL